MMGVCCTLSPSPPPGLGKEAPPSVKDDKEGGASSSSSVAGPSTKGDPDKHLPSFWIPSLTPVAKPTLLKKPVRGRDQRPGGGDQGGETRGETRGGDQGGETRGGRPGGSRPGLTPSGGHSVSNAV